MMMTKASVVRAALPAPRGVGALDADPEMTLNPPIRSALLAASRRRPPRLHSVLMEVSDVT